MLRIVIWHLLLEVWATLRNESKSRILSDLILKTSKKGFQKEDYWLDRTGIKIYEVCMYQSKDSKVQPYVVIVLSCSKKTTKVSSSYHLSVEWFSQLSFDSEVYTKSAAVADFVYTSELNESCEKHSTQRW